MKNKRNPMYLAIQSVLTTGALLSAGIAFAQDEDEDKVELERVVTTGTHIRTTDLENAAPVFTIDREDIQKTGLTDIGDILRQIPAAGASLNLSNNNGGDGSIRVDLRNLGSNRVLVLVNGRRWVRTLGGSADLTTIPTTIIERIDVLKDGASAIYGSDAISGVINIITRSDYEGVEASAYYGKTSRSDGARQQFNVAMGTASDRGSVFFNAEYTKLDSISAADRDISKLPLFATGNTGGSAGTPQGSFIIFSPLDGSFGGFNTTTPGSNGWNTPDDPDLIPFSDDTRFNYAPDNYLITPQDRTSIYVQGKYQLSDNVSVSSEAMFNRRESVALLAPQPLFFGFFTGARPGVNLIGIGGQNPYNPYGVDIPDTYIGLIGRRMVEAGNRIFSNKVDTYHYGLGFEGYIDAGTGWDWSVNYSFGRTDVARRGDGELNMTRVARALSNECVTDTSCVPLNIFGGQGSITQAMVDYITFEAHSFGSKKLIQYSGVVSSEIAELPAGALGFAAGYEHRRATGGFRPDYIITSGQTSGNQSDPTQGTTTVDEFFAELNVPLLADAPAAKVLELSLATRYSDYTGFGSSTNGKVGIRWKPIDDLLIRATYSEGFRAPNIAELFGGTGDSFPDLNDPCNGGEAANPDLPGCAGIPSTYQQANSQIRITVGSNPNLTPEESTSYTVGMVFEPSAVDGLVTTLDYYDIDIKNVVTNLSAFTVLNSCARTGTLFCNLLTRATSGDVTDVISSGINSAKLQVKGLDMNVSYQFDTDYGLFGLVWDTSYIDQYTFTNTDFVTGNLVANDGFNIEDSGVALPRVKSNLTADWSYGDWRVNYQLRYTAGQDEVCDPALNDSTADGLFRPDGDPTVPAGFQWCTFSAPSTTDGTLDARHVGGYTVHDVNVTYNLADYDMSFSVGIENLFDRDPSLSNNAFANSYDPGLYDGAGRYYWIKVDKRF
jgi:outer membrane receptor protein involved in Fe transport